MRVDLLHGQAKRIQSQRLQTVAPYPRVPLQVQNQRAKSKAKNSM